MSTPKKNTAFIFYMGVVSQAATKTLQVNPTIAAGDFKVSTDGGALGNLTTLPTVTPAGGKMVKVSLSAGEMNGDNITVVCSDAAGAEWCDALVNIATNVRALDDLAFPATSGRSLAVDTSGRALADVDTIKTNPVVNAGTVTFPTGATLASTTNLTAGTIANLTNLPAIPANWLTATGINAAALNGKGDWNVGKTGYSLTQGFPSNFSSLSITAGGLVDVTQTAADKAWATTTRRLSDGANIVLAKGVGLTGLTDLSASDVEDAVWDAMMADHITANSTGAKLNSAGAASDPWSIDLPGAYAAGSAGYILGNQLDVNVAAVNGVAVTGAGTALNPWGPV